MSLLSSTVAALTVAATLNDPVALLTPSAPNGPETLPAVCITRLGPAPPVEPPRWHRLVPTISFGFEIWPDRRDRFDRTTDLSATTPLRYQDRIDGRTRWTVDLRWRSDPRPDPVDTRRDPPALSERCARLLELRAEPPAELSDAVSQYVEVSRLIALIDAEQTEGGTDE